MRLALIGASGFVGSRVLAEAVQRGHRVSALVRDVTRLPDRAASQVSPLACDILRTGSLPEVLRGHDAVISAYNPGHDIDRNPQLYRDIVEGAVAMQRAVRLAAVPYFVYIGGAGSLLRRPGLRVADDPGFPGDYSVGVPEALQHFARQKQRSIDVPLAGRVTFLLFEHERSFRWSYLSPPLFMQPGVRSGRYVEGTDQFPWRGAAPAGISIEDFAVAVLDECEQQRHVYGHYTVTAD